MAAKTILLKGDHIRKEVVATGIVTPGMQVTLLGAAGGGIRKAFALENDLIGRGIDDDYAVGEVIQTGVMPPGAEVYALLASGGNVSAGAALKGKSDGTLEASAAIGDIIAYAIEAVNNTTSDPMRIRVEIA